MFKLLILDVDGVLTTGLKTYDLNGQVISNHQITSDAGHNTARFEARYDDQNSTNPQYNGNILMWVSEPGITYDSGGIGVNVHPSGHYYGRKYEDGKKITWKDGISALRCIFKYNLFN